VAQEAQLEGLPRRRLGDMATPMDTHQRATRAKTYPILSRDDVEKLIAQGRVVIIVDQHVLKVDPWIKYHPGGDKAIQHMVGRDATDEVNA